MSSNPTDSQPKIGYRTAHDDMVSFLRSPKMHVYRMDKRTAPGWHAALEELSAKAGVSPPALYHVPTHRINGGMALDALVLTDGLIQHLGCSHRDPHPSKGVMMVMAHELGHCKQGFAMKLGQTWLPWMLPMASIAALYIYDNTIKENKELSLENIGAAVNKTTDRLLRQLQLRRPDPEQDEHAHKVDTEWKKSLLNAGRYVLAGALGFGVGLAGARSMARHMEFDADRMAVKLMGSKQEYIDFLKKAQSSSSKQLGAEISQKPRPTEVTEKIQDFVSEKWKDLMAETVHAHPSMAEREAALNRTFKDIVTESRAGAPPHLSV
ncbi:MAG: M48 family metalloprotease [Alphaproteobacteria bacterium]|nr:M48 family metalloprotease [Alphaproteobacteria bacterium]